MKTKKTLVVGLAIAVMLGGALVAAAGVFPGHHRRGGVGPGVMGLKTLIELNLSDSQENQVLEILDRYEQERQDTVESFLDARKHLSTVCHAGEFNEDDIRNAFRQVSSIEEELFVLRARMMTELAAVLNSEQIELLKDRRTGRTERMRESSEAWIQKRGE
jgi:Spy/CpxP family protein refolding chaperone